MKQKMRNKEYADKMRQAADNWMDIMPVEKRLWLEIADRIEASPDPLQVQQANRQSRQVVLSTASSEESWFHKLFFGDSVKKGKTVELKPFDWGDLT